MGADLLSSTRTSRRDSLSSTIRPPVERAKPLRLPTITIGEGEGADADLVLTGELGVGGMGTVYRARHTLLEREVAVKILASGAAPKEVNAALHEAKVASRLDHPNIVPIHFVGIDAERGPVVVMKRVSGIAWSDKLRAGSELLDDLKLLVAIARALEFAHSRGVIHRDVKPANVMVGEFGEVYLLDWGVSFDQRKPDSSGLVGTPSYMAPEMAELGAVDARTDVYLLGATLHRLLTGESKHRGPSLEDALDQAARSEPYAYDETVHPDLAAICNRACHVQPDERFQSAEAFRVAIERFIESEDARTLLAAADRLADRVRDDIERDPTDGAAINKSLDRARFAYEQLSEQWPELAGAHAGHDRVVRLALQNELDRGNLDAARLLLPLLHDGDDADRESVAALSAEVSAREEALHAKARDADVRVGAIERYRFMIVCVAITWVISVAVVLHSGTEAISPAALTIFAAVGLLFACAVSWKFREKLRESLFNRLLIRVLVGGMVALTFHRMVGWIAGTPVTDTLVGDMLIIAACAPCVTPLLRSAVPLTAAALAGAAAGVVWPSTALLSFLILISALPVVIALEVRGQARASAAAPEPPTRSP